MARTNDLRPVEQDIEARFGRPAKELIRELYIDDGLSQDKVGERLDVSRESIGRLMKHHGIPTRYIGRGVRSKVTAA